MSATRKTKPDTSGPREADFYAAAQIAWLIQIIQENEK